MEVDPALEAYADVTGVILDHPIPFHVCLRRAIFEAYPVLAVKDLLKRIQRAHAATCWKCPLKDKELQRRIWVPSGCIDLPDYLTIDGPVDFDWQKVTEFPADTPLHGNPDPRINIFTKEKKSLRVHFVVMFEPFAPTDPSPDSKLDQYRFASVGAGLYRIAPVRDVRRPRCDWVSA